jgi:UDP-N-acetylmuramoylalanine--D-glutamate ligase
MMNDRSVDALRGKRVTLLGLGAHGGGVGVARFLARRGAFVTVTDAKPAESLAESVAALDGMPIRFVLGHHEDADFTRAGADMVIRNPGVPRRAPMLELARSEGVPVEMEMSLLFQFAPGPLIGVSGTKGKTTTSTLLGLMLTAWNPATRIAGNMGIPALELLDVIDAETPVVLEISSWQIEALDEHARSPYITVLTNVSPDHLNTYTDYEEYAETKRRLAAHQGPDDVLVFNADDPELRGLYETAPGRAIPFGHAIPGDIGMLVDGRSLHWRNGAESCSIHLPELAFNLKGDYQAMNVAAAAAAALMMGAPIEAVEAGIAAFDGVPNRGELVAEIGGVLFVNDTAATAPAAAIAALERFADQRIHLLSGGANKALDLVPLAEAITRHVTTLTLIDGSATPVLLELIRGAAFPVNGPYRDMESAIDAARADARSGDVVLLSPGVASFGVFTDEFDRGDQFRAAVERLSNRAETS